MNVKGKKADAERKLRALLSNYDRGIPVVTDKITVGDWLDRWYADYAIPRTRQMTCERYKRVVEKNIKPYIGHMQLTRLSPADIMTLEAEWSSKGLTPYNVKYSHGILSSALKYAMKMEILFRNPAKIVDPPRAGLYNQSFFLRTRKGTGNGDFLPMHKRAYCNEYHNVERFG